MLRSVIGGVFVIMCGMIVMSGIRLPSAAPNTTANFLLLGTTLICAISIPVYTNYVLGAEWLSQLPALLKLFVTNTVVSAVLLSVGLNLLLNIALKKDIDNVWESSLFIFIFA